VLLLDLGELRLQNLESVLFAHHGTTRTTIPLPVEAIIGEERPQGGAKKLARELGFRRPTGPYSHSMVPGGFEVMS
jgi:hypothetical protein